MNSLIVVKRIIDKIKPVTLILALIGLIWVISMSLQTLEIALTRIKSVEIGSTKFEFFPP